MSWFRRFNSVGLFLAVLSTLVSSSPAFATENDTALASNQAFFWKTGIYTTVAKTDFEPSWMRLSSTERRDVYLLTIHVTNIGALNVKNGYVDLLLADGWGYESSDGEFDQVTTQEKAYGQDVRWTLTPLATNRSAEIRVQISSDGAESTPILMAITSEYSAPLYAEITANQVRVTGGSDIYAVLRHALMILRITILEMWARFVTSVTLVAYQFHLSTYKS